MKTVLVCLTTIDDWRPKIQEIDKLGLTEIALFLTAIDFREREKLYEALSHTGIESIPCVHLRDDMTRSEIDHLIENYGSSHFNLHPTLLAAKMLEANPDLTDRIYIENLNSLKPIFFELANKAAGVCLDISHYEDFGVLQNCEGYDRFLEFLGSRKTGWSHISAISDKLSDNVSVADSQPIVEYNLHFLSDLHQMDYIKKHQEILPDVAAIELNNSLEEQLEISDYIRRLLR